jgi:Cd2+/Zn2+-exporting ATPase
VKAGEKIPVDGVVIKGEGSLDTSALTGESVPQTVSENSIVLSGAINLSSVLYIRAEKEFYDSTVAKILDMVENASAKKAKAEGKTIRAVAIESGVLTETQFEALTSAEAVLFVE